MRRVGMLASLVGLALCLLPTQARAAGTQGVVIPLQGQGATNMTLFILDYLNAQQNALENLQSPPVGTLRSWFNLPTVAAGGAATLSIEKSGLVAGCTLSVTFEDGQPTIALPFGWATGSTEASWQITAPTIATSVSAVADCTYGGASPTTAGLVVNSPSAQYS